MGKTRFTQAELERAMRAAKATGLPISRTEIAADGAIVIHHDKSDAADTLTPYQRWRAGKDASAAQGY